MSNLNQSREELDVVLHWRGKHAQVVKEREALQQRLTIADQRVDDLQSELTKVREFLRKCFMGEPLSVNDTDEIEGLLAHQSAPATKIDCGNCAFVEGVCATDCETKRIRDEQP